MVKFANDKSFPKRNNPPGRIDFRVDEFDQLIEDQGVRVKITPSILCPNRTEIHGTNHVLECPVCFGDEAVDLPKKSITTFAYIQGIKMDRIFEAQWQWDPKDAMISTQSDIRLYYWYKVEILDIASVYNQLIKRASTTVDNLRYIPIAASTDTDFHIIDSVGKEFEKDKHYRVKNQTIIWKSLVSGQSPEAGKLFSIVYPVLPTFRVLTLLHENRYYYVSERLAEKHPVNLPQQAVIRFDYLANDSGANGAKL